MPRTSSYRVRWEIDVDATSPEEAALRALKIMRDRDQVGVVFDVVKGTGIICDDCNLVKGMGRIDLEECAVCDNCGHLFRVPEDNDFATIPRLNERIGPGGMVPVCECPRCASLAYPARLGT